MSAMRTGKDVVMAFGSPGTEVVNGMDDPFVEVPLTRGMAAKVSPEDAERVLSQRWFAVPAKAAWYAVGYVPVEGKRKLTYLHRWLMDAKRGEIIDHENLDTLDCRRGNMRRATRSQSAANRRTHRTNKSGYKGVRLFKGRYQAQIYLNSRHIYLGRFDTAEEAAHAYDAKARELFGDFARLNFPDH